MASPGANPKLCRKPRITLIDFRNSSSISEHSFLLLLQSALQPLLLKYRWVFSAGRFYRVSLPAARQTPNLENQWLELSNSRHQVSLTSETRQANPSSGRWNCGREWAENFAESGDFHYTHSTLSYFITFNRLVLIRLRSVIIIRTLLSLSRHVHISRTAITQGYIQILCRHLKSMCVRYKCTLMSTKIHRPEIF